MMYRIKNLNTILYKNLLLNAYKVFFFLVKKFDIKREKYIISILDRVNEIKGTFSPVSYIEHDMSNYDKYLVFKFGGFLELKLIIQFIIKGSISYYLNFLHQLFGFITVSYNFSLYLNGKYFQDVLYIAAYNDNINNFSKFEKFIDLIFLKISNKTFRKIFLFLIYGYNDKIYNFCIKFEDKTNAVLLFLSQIGYIYGNDEADNIIEFNNFSETKNRVLAKAVDSIFQIIKNGKIGQKYYLDDIIKIVLAPYKLILNDNGNIYNLRNFEFSDDYIQDQFFSLGSTKSFDCQFLYKILNGKLISKEFLVNHIQDQIQELKNSGAITIKGLIVTKNNNFNFL